MVIIFIHNSFTQNTISYLVNYNCVNSKYFQHYLPQERLASKYAEMFHYVPRETPFCSVFVLTLIWCNTIDNTIECLLICNMSLGHFLKMTLRWLRFRMHVQLLFLRQLSDVFTQQMISRWHTCAKNTRNKYKWRLPLSQTGVLVAWENPDNFRQI